jgi:hypothetical protein
MRANNATKEHRADRPMLAMLPSVSDWPGRRGPTGRSLNRIPRRVTRIAELNVRDRPLAPVGRPDARRQLDVQLGIDPSLIGEPAWVGEGTRPKPINDPELHIVIRRCSRNRFPAVHGRPRSLREPPSRGCANATMHGCVPVRILRISCCLNRFIAQPQHHAVCKSLELARPPNVFASKWWTERTLTDVGPAFGPRARVAFVERLRHSRAAIRMRGIRIGRLNVQGTSLRG